MDIELTKRIISSIVLIPISLTIVIKGGIIFDLLIVCLFSISVYEWNKMTLKKLYKYSGFFLLLFAFYTIYKIRYEFNVNYNYFIFVLLICISTDVGGFVFGKVLKGPKLTKISPKKTYAGVLGGYMLSLISIYLFVSVFNSYLGFNSIDEILLITLLISTISQIGDIIISYFKRLSNLKDTGKIIPGHGGILDRIDGMVFAFPFFYILLQFKIILP